MGLRFRKSFKVAPGVRVNVGKKSVGVSVGGKGYRTSINSSGRVTTSVGVPGTGLSYVDTKNVNSKKNKSSSKRASSATASASSAHSSATTAAASNSVQKAAVQPKKEKPKTKTMVVAKPDGSNIVAAIIFGVVAIFFSDISAFIAIVLALFGVYFIYEYIAFKRHPDNPEYVTDEQLARWRQLVHSEKETVHELEKVSLPVLLDLKAQVSNYYKRLSAASSKEEVDKWAELLLNTQNKIVDLSEFIILDGDEPKMDLDRYLYFVENFRD